MKAGDSRAEDPGEESIQAKPGSFTPWRMFKKFLMPFKDRIIKDKGRNLGWSRAGKKELEQEQELFLEHKPKKSKTVVYQIGFSNSCQWTFCFHLCS